MLPNIDLHTLRVLNEIFATGSLSRAADRLSTSQPAISMILRKLRKHFDDKLFVRVGNEMKPTPQAEGMRDSVSAAIAAIEVTLNFRSVFDPASTHQTFRIAVSDIGQIVIVPKLLKTLAEEAPHANIELSRIGEHTPQMLQTGLIDLAVGLAPRMPGGFFQRVMYEEGFVILARSEHPRISGTLTLEQFKTESHAVVVSSSSTHLVIDKALEEKHLCRKAAIRLPNFVLLAKLIAETDYITILPRRAGLAMAGDGQITAYDPPFFLPKYQVRQYWHERQSRDLRSRWLRDLFMRLFAE
jgi:DNA-binding transcriptional LysR family regulator